MSASGEIDASRLPAASPSVSTADRIFVSVIAYRDPEVVPTMRSLFSQAVQAERVVVGVVWQGDDADDTDRATLDALDAFARTLPHGSVRVLRLAHTEARGPCFARALAQQQLFQDEPFYLQLDSHMRMAVGWDEELLRQWRTCDDERAVITTYPPPYERGSEGSSADSSSTNIASSAAPTSSSSLDASTPPTILCASHFHASDGMLRIVGRTLAAAPSRPVETAFCAAGFCFAAARMVKEVPYDPHLKNLFFGEESSMAARLFTHGFRCFAPTRNIAWHCWSRSYRPSFRDLTKNADASFVRAQQRREELARTRVRHVLGMPPHTLPEADSAVPSPVAPAACSQAAGDDTNDPSLSSSLSTPLEPYALGPRRSLAEFYSHSGVDFSRREVHERGKNGGFDARMFQQTQDRAAQLAAVMALVQKTAGGRS